MTNPQIEVTISIILGDNSQKQVTIPKNMTFLRENASIREYKTLIFAA
jgi:hypothetical protein